MRTTAPQAPRPHRRDVLAGGLGLIVVPGCSAPAQAAKPVSGSAASDVAAGEALVLFDAAGHLAADGASWLVHLHAWVYAPQDSRARKAVIARLLARTYGLAVTPDAAPYFDRRVNLLLADNLPGRRIVAELAGQRLRLPPTGVNGHTRLEVRIPVSPLAPPEGGVIEVVAALAAGDPRRIAARVSLLPPTGTSLISDIDDTVKQTGVTDKRRLWEATFFKPFEAVPGMAALLDRLARPRPAVHYVSSSPWHLYPPLSEWMGEAHLLATTLDLKQIRLKDQSILDLFKSPTATKPPAIDALLARWPGRDFILIGDSGEKDPEVYAAAARRHGARIGRILIRRAGGDISPARFTAAFAALPARRWQVFTDPAEVLG